VVRDSAVFTNGQSYGLTPLRLTQFPFLLVTP
jgi:hypothetical protein